MINIIEGKWEALWKIRIEMSSINFWRKKRLVHFAHILREGNEVLNFAGIERIQYQNFQSSPSRKLLNSDKQQLPQIRFNTFRNREQDSIFKITQLKSRFVGLKAHLENLFHLF